MSTSVTEPTAPDELVERGQQIYDEQLKDLLEPAENGRFVAIEPDSGKYFLGDKGIDALLRGRAAIADKLFYLVRIGYPAAYKIGGYGLRLTPDSQDSCVFANQTGF